MFSYFKWTRLTTPQGGMPSSTTPTHQGSCSLHGRVSWFKHALCYCTAAFVIWHDEAPLAQFSLVHVHRSSAVWAAGAVALLAVLAGHGTIEARRLVQMAMVFELAFMVGHLSHKTQESTYGLACQGLSLGEIFEIRYMNCLSSTREGIPVLPVMTLKHHQYFSTCTIGLFIWRSILHVSAGMAVSRAWCQAGIGRQHEHPVTWHTSACWNIQHTWYRIHLDMINVVISMHEQLAISLHKQRFLEGVENPSYRELCRTSSG